jgi:hypothetical protein
MTGVPTAIVRNSPVTAHDIVLSRVPSAWASSASEALTIVIEAEKPTMASSTVMSSRRG